MSFKQFTEALGGLLLVLVALPCAAVEWAFEDIGPREPAHVSTRMEMVEGSSGPCGLASLNRTPITDPFAPMPMGSALVGFDNTVRRGADPFPCNRQFSRGFTAGFRFALDDVMHTLVERATLVIYFSPSGLPWRPTVGAGSEARCAISALRAIEDWRPNAAIEEAPTIATVPIIRDRFTHRILNSQTVLNFSSPVRMDVTHTLRQWVGSYPNHGFVLRIEGADGRYLAANDKSCTSYVRARLEMRVGRLVNRDR